MTGTFYTADPHLFHPRVATERGFSSPEEHDKALMKRWNRVVAPEDTVWLLGDVGMGDPARVLDTVDQLHGEIHLITGNHDVVWPGHRDSHKHQRTWMRHFASVQTFARRRISGVDVLLAHLPYVGDHVDKERYTPYRLVDHGMPLICGHVHGAWQVWGRQINVGLEQWGLRPVHEADVAKLVHHIATVGPFPRGVAVEQS